MQEVGQMAPLNPNRNKASNDSINSMGERVGVLSQRVTNIEGSITDIRRELHAVSNELGTAIANVSAKLDEKNRPQWGIILSAASFMLAFVTTIGILAYLPIKSEQTALRDDLQSLQDTNVPRAEYDRQMALIIDGLKIFDQRFVDIGSTYMPRQEYESRHLIVEKQIDDLTASTRYNAERIVPRGEHEQKWDSVENQIVSLREDINEMRQIFGNAYSLGEALQSLQERIERIETMRLHRNETPLPAQITP